MATLKTPLCDLLGIEAPIIQAPIGSASAPALAAAVSNAGGLGMLSVTWRSLDETRAAIRATRRLTDRPFGINLVLHWPPEERLALCLEEGVRIVSFFWGDPAPSLETVKAAGGLVIHTAGSAAEARQAVAAGVDVVVAQGWEAGGHVRGDVGALALVPAVVDAVAPTPVVAAGGIADGRGLAAALALGAAGIWLGTRFLASVEALAHPRHQALILQAAETETRHSTLFDGGWPGAPQRTLRAGAVRAWEEAGCPPRGARPGEGEVVAWEPSGTAVRRYDDRLPDPSLRGDIEALALYAGQSAGLIHALEPAGEIVRRIAGEAVAALTQAARLVE